MNVSGGWINGIRGLKYINVMNFVNETYDNCVVGTWMFNIYDSFNANFKNVTISNTVFLDNSYIMIL